MSMFLTLGVTILDSTRELQLVLSYQCTVCAPVRSANTSVYIQITLVFLTASYMRPISPSVDSEAIAG